MISDENTFAADRCPTGAYSGQDRRLFGEIEKRGEKTAKSGKNAGYIQQD